MLVIISDTHLTDGTSGKTVSAGAFRLFRERLCDLAYEASWRKGGRYEPIQELTLLLMGDILDLIRSTEWLKTENLRPWSNPEDAAFIKTVETITDRILKHGSESFAILKSLSRGNQVTIPRPGPDVKRGSTDRQPVKVHIHYMIGNHDWFYHLPAVAYKAVRLRIYEEFGLDLNYASGDPFPHRIEESGAEAIRRVCEEHYVYARHGEIYDPINFDDDRNRSSLGDALVVELIERFTETVNDDFEKSLGQEFVEGLNEIDNLRPYTVIPTWICGWLKETCPDPEIRKTIKRVWADLVNKFFKLDFVRQQYSLPHCLADRKRLWFLLKIRIAFNFSRLIILPFFDPILSISARWFGGQDGPPNFRHAGNEPALKKRQALYVAYGHTHQYDLVPLRSPTRDLKISGGQVYLNSGTWRPYHELTRLHPTKEEFVGYEVMSYIAFYKGDERGGRPFETWSGVLAPA
jgi:hypothetical protein